MEQKLREFGLLKTGNQEEGKMKRKVIRLSLVAVVVIALVVAIPIVGGSNGTRVVGNPGAPTLINY